MKTNFGKTPGFFDFVINAYFGNLDKLQAKYLCDAFVITDNKMNEQQIIEQEKLQYKQLLKDKLIKNK